MVFMMQDKLFEWYGLHGRHDLPWRNTKDAYHIYLSEIMLQQTQVKTVLERFYFPFLEAFSTLKSVADAPLDDVLKKWEGLGYYTRAKNLHHTAFTCKGVLPENIAELEALKGIGKSTAYAIGVFAYGQVLPILDANVKRVLCRFFGLSTKNEKVLWEKAREFLNQKYPYEHNQALMDLGSLICTSSNPLCEKCPLHVKCIGKIDPCNYPLPQKKNSVPLRKKIALVIQKNGKLGLIQRKERLLHGLWGFTQVLEMPTHYTSLGKVVHTYTHFKLELEVLLCEPIKEVDGWFSLAEIDTLAVSTVDKKILELLHLENALIGDKSYNPYKIYDKESE